MAYLLIAVAAGLVTWYVAARCGPAFDRGVEVSNNPGRPYSDQL